MASFQAVYLRLDGRPLSDVEALARHALRADTLKQCVLRQPAKGAWLQLQPDVVGVPIGPSNPFTGEPLLDEWPGLSAFVKRLSADWASDIVTLEVQTSADWIRFSRWQAGRCVRVFEYCSQEDEPFAKDEGEPEAWERTGDEEQVSDGVAVAKALELPGFDGAPWARELTLSR